MFRSARVTQGEQASGWVEAKHGMQSADIDRLGLETRQWLGQGDSGGIDGSSLADDPCLRCRHPHRPHLNSNDKKCEEEVVEIQSTQVPILLILLEAATLTSARSSLDISSPDPPFTAEYVPINRDPAFGFPSALPCNCNLKRPRCILKRSMFTTLARPLSSFASPYNVRCMSTPSIEVTNPLFAIFIATRRTTSSPPLEPIPNSYVPSDIRMDSTGRAERGPRSY
ncbi:hypothetical protein ACRALDRAFT_206070 [Sodiomyces alcalophilus JCM 7366]|uniref:uncharacterized protein n=1 Tax=Sodiomyces alcalophilus JCM 7366 TaxID=591952 RepID=UPI0039B452CB